MRDRLIRLPYYRWLVFAVIATGTFMSTLTSSILNVALPLIQVSLGTDLLTVQWVVTAYLLVVTGFLPLAGRLGDVAGRRRIYSAGFIGFAVGSLLCGLARSVEGLIVFRLLQGLGAAALMANSPAIVTEVFPRKERGKVLGMVGTAVALGSMTGPSLGGILVEQLGWHALFFLNLPVALLGYGAAYLVLPLDKRWQGDGLDVVGAGLFTGGVVSFSLALSQGGKWGWLAGGLVVLGTLQIWMFYRWEKWVPQPMIDLTIFDNWPFVVGNLTGLLSFMAIFANTILFPFYLFQVKGLTPGEMGLVMSAFPLVMAIVAPLSGALSDRAGPLLLTCTGLTVVAGGLYYTGNLGAGAGIGSIVAGQALLGLGNGLFQSPNNNSVMSALDPAKAGLAGGINALSRNLGMISGTAIAVSVCEFGRQASLTTGGSSSREVTAFLQGYHWAFLLAAGIAVLGVLLSLNRQGYAGYDEKQ
ncbi:MAG TPA: MFS transporter [Patescibacteria group bacterium]|nr:MFS transporter [Patescibacteria group bacterium]